MQKVWNSLFLMSGWHGWLPISAATVGNREAGTHIVKPQILAPGLWGNLEQQRVMLSELRRLEAQHQDVSGVGSFQRL